MAVKEYTLWLEDADGKINFLAKAIDSPYWEAMLELAEDFYGKDRVSYTES